MPTQQECIDELAALIAGLPTGGPLLRTGTIASVGGATVVIDGVEMPFVDVGVTPAGGRTGVYFRQGTGAVCMGMLAV